MTAPLRSTPHASAIPASQNTAPVAEFRCLFTHDIRRKQKRWQDGYLKFHTFNNRVMVYDQARNFLGDTYYKDSNELQEGDELNLDKGVMIEVAEAIGVTQTDLTPLFEKKTKEPTPRPTAASQTRPFQRPSSVAPSNPQRTGSQLRHKSLNTLLGTPKGPIGKAMPMQSPYEARKEKENALAEERTTKRQKTAHTPAPWRASSPVQEESPVASRDLPLWARTSDVKNARKPAKFIPPAATIITLDSEPEPEPDPVPAFHSDVTLPSTPPRVVKAKSKPLPIPTPIADPVIPEKLPVQTPRIPRGKVPVPKVKALETPKRPAPPSSPPVSASNRLTNVNFAVQPAKKSAKEPSPLPSPPRNPKTKSLRLSTGVKRGTLLCQSLPQQASRAGRENRASSATSNHKKTSRISSKEPSPALSYGDGVHQRGGASTTMKESALPKGKRKGAEALEDGKSKRARVSRSSPEASPDLFDDPEIMHGIMDQQLLVPSSPVQLQEARSPSVEEIPIPKHATARKTTRKDVIASKRNVPEAPKAEDMSSRSHSPTETTRRAQPRKKAAEKPLPSPKESCLPAPVFEPSIFPSREVSPSHTEASDTRSRTSSTSPSKVALSTGGFRKKPKRPARQSAATTTPDMAVPAPRNETVALPPHPLRAGKKGPLMSTTELAALLQKPKKVKKTLNDPIEDEAPGVGKSPNRTFRRVRSENDAPIPSTAEDWEKRNLPKSPTNLTEPGIEPAVAVPPQEPAQKKNTGLSALIKKTDPRRKFQRTQSLSVDTSVPPAQEPELPSPVVDQDVGPWSTEAFDLFDWRPPNRD